MYLPLNALPSFWFRLHSKHNRLFDSFPTRVLNPLVTYATAIKDLELHVRSHSLSRKAGHSVVVATPRLQLHDFDPSSQQATCKQPPQREVSSSSNQNIKITAPLLHRR